MEGFNEDVLGEELDKLDDMDTSDLVDALADLARQIGNVMWVDSGEMDVVAGGVHLRIQLMAARLIEALAHERAW